MIDFQEFENVVLTLIAIRFVVDNRIRSSFSWIVSFFEKSKTKVD